MANIYLIMDQSISSEWNYANIYCNKGVLENRNIYGTY